jgi:hypothetical protein
VLVFWYFSSDAALDEKLFGGQLESRWAGSCTKIVRVAAGSG